MTAQEALKTALRDILGPAARSHGYKGSAPNWRKSESGDWAIVNVQSSSWSSAEQLQCVVNLAFAPEPWLRWSAQRLGRAPKAVSESYGLYRERLHPEGTPAGADGWWEVVDDASARTVVADMCAQLERAGWPVLDEMFSRGALMARLRDGDLGMMKRSNFEKFFNDAEALLLMDAGPSDELEQRLAATQVNVLPNHRAHTEKFVTWVRAQAAKASDQAR